MNNAIILAAGLGKRLEPLTDVKPKPLVPVGNKPILSYTLKLLENYSINKLAINLFHLPDLIIDWIRAEPIFSRIKIDFSLETNLLGTAGGIKKAASMLEEPPFLIINSDILIDLNLLNLLEFHRQKHAVATMVLRPDPLVTQFGIIKIDDQNRVRQFLESSHEECSLEETPLRELMFTGVQIVETEFLESIPYGEYKDLSQDIYPQLMKNNLPIYGYVMEGYWTDIGTPLRYFQANMDCLSGGLNPLFSPSQAELRQGINKNKSAMLLPPVAIGQNCSIGEKCIIGPLVSIGDAAILGNGLKIEKSIIWENTCIGNGAQISNSIVMSNVEIPAKAILDRVIVSKHKTSSLDLIQAPIN